MAVAFGLRLCLYRGVDALPSPYRCVDGFRLVCACGALDVTCPQAVRLRAAWLLERHEPRGCWAHSRHAGHPRHRGVPASVRVRVPRGKPAERRHGRGIPGVLDQARSADAWPRGGAPAGRAVLELHVPRRVQPGGAGDKGAQRGVAGVDARRLGDQEQLGLGLGLQRGRAGWHSRGTLGWRGCVPALLN